jgi:hypothetical protein
MLKPVGESASLRDFGSAEKAVFVRFRAIFVGFSAALTPISHDSWGF